MIRRRPQSVSLRPPTPWQVIFAQSKANGAAYRGESLPHHRRIWPRGFLEKRLEQIRREAR